MKIIKDLVYLFNQIIAGAVIVLKSLAIIVAIILLMVFVAAIPVTLQLAQDGALSWTRFVIGVVSWFLIVSMIVGLIQDI